MQIFVFYVKLDVKCCMKNTIMYKSMATSLKMVSRKTRFQVELYKYFQSFIHEIEFEVKLYTKSKAVHKNIAISVKMVSRKTKFQAELSKYLSFSI